MWLEKVTVGVNVNNIKEKIDEKKIAFFFTFACSVPYTFPG